jgi:acyl-CoA reductase-like NAD-dependent aldehyde dehydrogenase
MNSSAGMLISCLPKKRKSSARFCWNQELLGKSADCRPAGSQNCRDGGLDVPAETKMLIGEMTEIREDEPFAHEKLSPLLGLIQCKDFDEGIRMAQHLVELGGSVTRRYFTPTS